MSLRAVVMTTDIAQANRVRFDEFDLVDVLGESEEAVGVRIDEVVRAVADSVRASIEAESELTVEVTGSISLKAEAGAKWMFFNLGGSATESDSLKVTLKTKVAPASS